MRTWIWVTALRVSGGLAVFVVPLPAFWVSGHLDRRDWSWLGMPTASAQQQHVYQYWDKSVDTFILAIALIVALSWRDPVVRRLAILTFAWRAVGVIVFIVTGERAVFVVFPSVFERLFFFYLIFRVLSRDDVMLRSWWDVAVTMIALTVPKVVDEYFTHVAVRWPPAHLLPASLSTPGREYWLWEPIILVLPVLAMARLLLQRHEASGEKLPLVAALLGRQVSGVPDSSISGEAQPLLQLGSVAISDSE